MSTHRAPIRTSILAVLTTLLVAASLPKMFMRPQALPVKRLVQNLTRLVEAEPKDHDLHYRLARVHYLALANRTLVVPAFDDRRGPRPAPRHLSRFFVSSLRYDEATARARKALGFDEDTRMDKEKWQKLDAARKTETQKLEAAGWHPPAPTMEELHRHAEQAMVHFQKAITLAPENALYRLGRVCLAHRCLELELAGKLPRRRVLKHLEQVTWTTVRDDYRATFDLAYPKDIENGSIPVEGVGGLVSFEAGEAWVKLTGRRPELAKGQEKTAARIQEGLEKLPKLKRGPITPILIGNRPGDRLSDLVDPAASVEFDLDGDDVLESWPWVRRDAGILAWDPTGRGEITSGRELFGSVTWFVFHRDGYAALQLLDDDGDGQLTDLELDGLAIWRDVDGDGVAGPREVQPLWRAGVRSLATRGTVAEGVLGNRRGVRYAGGRAVPTFDWVTRARCSETGDR